MNGVSFDRIHSFYKLGLILSKAEITPAQAKTQYVDIAGGDGSIDLTEALGEVKYKDRECKFIFTVNPACGKTFEEKKTEVSNLLGGKRFKITLDKDRKYYYSGRCEIDSFSSNKSINQIVVKAKVAPYKLKQFETVIPYKLTSEPKTVTIKNGRKPVTPYIECTDDNTKVTFGSVTVNIGKGTHQFLDIRFSEGINTLEISGAGTITFRFQEGDF